MVTAAKRLLVGNPLKSKQAVHERLTRKTALAVCSSDALSSTVYATEGIPLTLATIVAKENLGTTPVFGSENG